MKRTTVYFPDEMKAAIEREAGRHDVTEAEVIRRALQEHLEQVKRPRPTVPLFPEGLGRDLSSRVGELLEGFGDDR